MQIKSNIQLVFFLGLASLLISCSKHITTSKALVIYPAPPDTARIQFLTSFSNSIDIVGKRSSFEKSVLGDDKALPVGKPYGIATTKGQIFLCDASIKGIDIIDLSKKTFNRFLPSGNGQLKMPINCYVSEDRMFIADVQRNEVVVFDNKYNYVTAIGKLNADDHFKPMDVCGTGNKIWVTNPISHQINMYQKDTIETAKFISGDTKYVKVKEKYNLVKAFPDTVQGNDEYLNNPINITYQNGKVYVTDFGDFKIKIFSEEGNFLGAVGKYGNTIGQFVRPKGIAVDKEDNLYVVDAGFENVQIFNPENKLLMYFGGPYKGKGDMWLPAKVYIDYENLEYYKKWVSPDYELNYLIFVTNQYGPDKVNVYGSVRPK